MVSFISRDDSSYFVPRRLASSSAFPRCWALSAVDSFDHECNSIREFDASHRGKKGLSSRDEYCTKYGMKYCMKYGMKYSSRYEVLYEIWYEVLYSMKARTVVERGEKGLLGDP